MSLAHSLCVKDVAQDETHIWTIYGLMGGGKWLVLLIKGLEGNGLKGQRQGDLR